MVVVPDVPAAVPEFRLRLDPAAALGIPEHITIMYPFVPPAGLGEDVVARVATLCSRHKTFEFELGDVRWFGEEVVWLAPSPDEPFRALTLEVAAEFGIQPYGGAYAEVTPHLTLGYRAPVEAMREAAEAIKPQPPVACCATGLALFGGSPQGWTELHRFGFR